MARAREALRHDERTRPLRLPAHGSHSFPDCLLPLPVGVSSVDAELDIIRATPGDVVLKGVREHYAGMEEHPHVRPYVDDPESACATLAEAYAAYWEGALEQHWPTGSRPSWPSRAARYARSTPPAGSSPAFRNAISGRSTRTARATNTSTASVLCPANGARRPRNATARRPSPYCRSGRFRSPGRCPPLGGRGPCTRRPPAGRTEWAEGAGREE